MTLETLTSQQPTAGEIMQFMHISSLILCWPTPVLSPSMMNLYKSRVAIAKFNNYVLCIILHKCREKMAISMDWIHLCTLQEGYRGISCMGAGQKKFSMHGLTCTSGRGICVGCQACTCPVAMYRLLLT